MTGLYQAVQLDAVAAAAGQAVPEDRGDGVVEVAVGERGVQVPSKRSGGTRPAGSPQTPGRRPLHHTGDLVGGVLPERGHPSHRQLRPNGAGCGQEVVDPRTSREIGTAWKGFGRVLPGRGRGLAGAASNHCHSVPAGFDGFRDICPYTGGA